MNEVKKSLDAVSGINSEDVEEVKRRVLSGKRRQKKRNPFPGVATALVAAAVLFFAFNLLKDDFSTGDDEKYEVNELIYGFMLRTESNGNEDGATAETKQAVLSKVLQIDAVLEYAESLGYEEDTEAIEEALAEQRDTFYADLDKEDEEKKKTILQTQERNFGISYDDYFNVILKWTYRYDKAEEWLVRHPQEKPITKGEVLGSFQNKHEHAIADFMEQKSIPPFDLSVNYKELEGTVAAIDGEQVLITQGFVEDAPSKKDKLIINGAAARFVIPHASNEISPGMDIRIVYDTLAYPVTSRGSSLPYEKVTEWEVLSTNTVREFTPGNPTGVSEKDIETAYDMCVTALTDYYKAVWNGSAIDLDSFIENENLKQYINKKVQSEYDRYGGFNDPVKDVEIGDWEAKNTEDANGGFLYLHVPVMVNKDVGSYGEATEFLVRNVNGKLVIVDWYTGGKDTYDFIVRGENETIDNPDTWNDQEWVKKFDGSAD
ncbi:hypothetical protein [Sporosarcina luteola]|uniref:hypothetical protein n=1 Tax=Sporosarcina luteola TaxID=582850 RepID=UPI00203D96DE|nr:hypothetical protein [Sporosarcina luteola]MCM3711544.1 hypothetical protein [Sporosarcina luteola]